MPQRLPAGSLFPSQQSPEIRICPQDFRCQQCRQTLTGKPTRIYSHYLIPKSKHRYILILNQSNRNSLNLTLDN
ncbi:unnamed protein product [Linum tenue]|uniref:Uncharacterized protein n=1 Tax=Linum tenue TaxID=586396 RepID=A0AAV0JQ64_9ROSI|nr:unnamed protein product [Linum tenue]